MKWYRRFEAWLIIGAIFLALVISCSGCTRAEPRHGPGNRPEPSHIVSRYSLTPELGGEVEVIEFRDSAGRICVATYMTYRWGTLDCGMPLPPLNYEDLPPAEGEKP